MGSGIAQVCAQAGLDVVGVDVAPGAAAHAHERIAGYLARGVEKGRLSAEQHDAALERLALGDDLAALGGWDAGIEAIVQEPGAKQAPLAQPAPPVGAEALPPTNTAGRPLSRVARDGPGPGR